MMTSESYDVFLALLELQQLSVGLASERNKSIIRS